MRACSILVDTISNPINCLYRFQSVIALKNITFSWNVCSHSPSPSPRVQVATSLPGSVSGGRMQWRVTEERYTNLSGLLRTISTECGCADADSADGGVRSPEHEKTKLWFENPSAALHCFNQTTFSYSLVHSYKPVLRR